MWVRTESCDRRRSDPKRRRIGRHQFRVPSLQLLELPEESVMLRVADFGRVEDVVAVRVVLDQATQLFSALGRGYG